VAKWLCLSWVQAARLHHLRQASRLSPQAGRGTGDPLVGASGPLAPCATSGPLVATAEPPLPQLPKAGGTLTDPTFGTTLMRLTDETDGKHCHRGQPLKYKIAATMLFCILRADPDAFKLLGKEPLFAKKPPSNYEPRWEDSIWSGKDPDLLFCHQGLNLWCYNVAAKSYTLVKDFAGLVPPGHLAQMSKSLDDNVFAFSLQDPKWNLIGFVVFTSNWGGSPRRDAFVLQVPPIEEKK